MIFNDETFGKGFIDDNGILVKLERYCTTEFKLIT